ncbi:MAG TPA: hypothetical protein VL593_02340 [Ramlibacter sp.]|nr:hypothetical protein [Ramlibacter sp.]
MKSNQSFAAAFSLAFVAGGTRAQSEAEALGDLCALPIASVSPPGVLSSGAVFVVKRVDETAYATAYSLERVSDGTHVSIEIATRGVRHVTVLAGALVKATLLNTGMVLTAGSEAIAFVPNALGRALLHNERVTP